MGYLLASLIAHVHVHVDVISTRKSTFVRAHFLRPGHWRLISQGSYCSCLAMLEGIVVAINSVTDFLSRYARRIDKSSPAPLGPAAGNCGEGDAHGNGYAAHLHGSDPSTAAMVAATSPIQARRFFRSAMSATGQKRTNERFLNVAMCATTFPFR